jgi:soluble lytic murein transglycosylase-like protein
MRTVATQVAPFQRRGSQVTLIIYGSMSLYGTRGQSLRNPRQSNAFVACAFVLFASSALADTPDAGFPLIPLPPVIEGLIGMPQAYTPGRRAHLDTIRREAEQAGLPPEIADAVAQVESAYNPRAVGGVGEVGLMQIRPTTAAMLGYRGGLNGLFEPETNIRYGVMYLARAWKLADGDLCRTLMKYRAGHGEERMTPLSVEYCRRVQSHLATIGSPLGGGASPARGVASAPFGASNTAVSVSIKAAGRPVASIQVRKDASATAAIPVLPPQRPAKGLRLAMAGPPGLSPAEARNLVRLQEKQKARRIAIRQMWTAHEARMRIISAKLRPDSLRIASGI